MLNQTPDVTAVASVYANLPYAVQLETDSCDGTQYIMAYNPELSGCMAQGGTAQEAICNLAEAREELIVALLERNLPVPTPKSISQVVKTAENTFWVNYAVSQTVSWTGMPTTRQAIASPAELQQVCPA